MKEKGRKSLYDQKRVAEKLDAIHGWALHGGNKYVAEKLGVAERTLYAWAARHEELREVLKTSREEANGELLLTAYDMARGYYRDVTEVVTVREYTIDQATGRKIPMETAKTVKYRKYFPPDPRILTLMLTNNLRSEYQKNPQFVNMNVNAQGEMTEEDKELMKRVGDRLAPDR